MNEQDREFIRDIARTTSNLLVRHGFSTSYDGQFGIMVWPGENPIDRGGIVALLEREEVPIDAESVHQMGNAVLIDLKGQE